MSTTTLRDVGPGDEAAAMALLDAELGGRHQVRLGETHDVLAMPAIGAWSEDQLVGLVTFENRDDRIEVAALVVAASHRRQGLAGDLIEEVARVGAEQHAGELWLVTTNDNLDALRLYQRRGFELRTVHPHAVDRAREVKPSIPETGNFGIPIRDELVLVRPLSPPVAVSGPEPVASEVDYLQRNQDAWNRNAASYAESGRRDWGSDPFWGIWRIDESELGLLTDVDDLDVVELGCGTGYVSAWVARRGGRPVGVDPTVNQLATARVLQDEFDLHYPLVRAAAEQVPLRDASFDLVISEYGAAIWSDPYRWIPEAARLLRPGGELTFLGNGALLMLCAPDEDGVAADRWLRRPYFGMHRFEWPDDTSVEFHLGYGDWIRLLRANGFVVEDLLELRPPPDATTSYPFVNAEWARQWPSEEVWRARKQTTGA